MGMFEKNRVNKNIDTAEANLIGLVI